MPVSSKFQFEVEGFKAVIFFFCDQPLQSESQHRPAEPFARHWKPLAFFCFSSLSHLGGGTKPCCLQSLSRTCWCYKRSLDIYYVSPVEERWLSATIVISFQRGLIGLFLRGQILTHCLYACCQENSGKIPNGSLEDRCPRLFPLQTGGKNGFHSAWAAANMAELLERWQKGGEM